MLYIRSAGLLMIFQKVGKEILNGDLGIIPSKVRRIYRMRREHTAMPQKPWSWKVNVILYYLTHGTIPLFHLHSCSESLQYSVMLEHDLFAKTNPWSLPFCGCRQCNASGLESFTAHVFSHHTSVLPYYLTPISYRRCGFSGSVIPRALRAAIRFA